MSRKSISIKKLAAAAGIVAGLAVLAPATANADTGYQVRTVAAGQTTCVQDPHFFAYSVRGEGTVLAGHNVRFVVSRYAPSYKLVADSVNPVPAFAFETYAAYGTGALPGQFQICAVNQSLKSSTVQLRVSGS